ncbi:MAG: hypothetical protein KZQ82_12865 [Candidatus Thiodiazotropha sp. (ex Lucinoma annulata)]|nr:hypothetical protein [Candidatus Thiodiazotropha sp. (ex Troendleina suluensis)]MCU7885074.1 hypothetical protein [Candidatus Thiodiazotropha sp. (ex Lucinoma annulata)]
MSRIREKSKVSRSLKEGPVIYQSEDSLLDEDRIKKDLTLAELNHVLKLYLARKKSHLKDLSILGQFSVIFNDRRFSEWHTFSKSEQSDALSEFVVLPDVYKELIEKIAATAGDAQIISAVVKDAYQNSIDSFSHAAFTQWKYISRFPGFKVILYLDQVHKNSILVVVDNGFGENVDKPKKSFLGEEIDDSIVNRITEWIFNKFEKNEKNIDHRIAYTGGQGMALKKIKIELDLDVDLYFFSTGAVFELKLKNFF